MIFIHSAFIIECPTPEKNESIFDFSNKAKQSIDKQGRCPAPIHKVVGGTLIFPYT